MWFVVVYSNSDTGELVCDVVNHTQLFSRYDFGSHVQSVFAFTQKAGIGDVKKLKSCIIVRTR